MPNRLEPLNLMDFTGGWNNRRNQFQLAENESPDLLNVDIDPRGGFYTRRGWMRWNIYDVVDMETETWEPRNLFVHTNAQGAQRYFVTNDGLIHHANDLGEWDVAPTTCTADPHGADFASWGDFTYVARGMATASMKISTAGVETTLDPDNWSEVDTPTLGVMPQFEYVTAHAGYLFGAVTIEALTTRWHRIRWSHPNTPDAWREDDFIDIEAGGSRITGLMPYGDHLLIFKTNSVWALFGYSDQSWQLVKITDRSGAPCRTAITRNENAVFYYSAFGRGGIYGYSGNDPTYLSEKVQVAFEEVLTPLNVFVSWAGSRLWVSMPWSSDLGGTEDPTSAFIFDPQVGDGAWTQYRSDYGAVGPVTDTTDVDQRYPMAALWSTETACLINVDVTDDAYDVILEPSVIGIPPDALLVTDLDEELLVGGDGFIGQPFDAYYRTRWLHAGWPDRKKSWRRPTFICRGVPRDTALIVEAYRDYDETTVHRSRTLQLTSVGTAYWRDGGFDDPGGFDWTEGGAEDPSGRGADWGSEVSGSTVKRGGSLGLAKSVQLRVLSSPSSVRNKWGVDGVVAKIVMRRFR